MLVCENLEGTLAEFFTLRGSIFDFQFDLVDALTKVVQGNIAQKLSSSIKGKNKLLDYKYHGKRDKLCPTSGFFDYNKVEYLTSIKEPHYYKQERYVFIPTSPEYPGDSGYINLPSLAAGNQPILQLAKTTPEQHSWIKQMVDWNDVIAPFVTSIKIYLPLVVCTGSTALLFTEASSTTTKMFVTFCPVTGEVMQR
ncbi:Hypothetical predicted protein, partial [Paramuricea clavata]